MFATAYTMRVPSGDLTGSIAAPAAKRAGSPPQARLHQCIWGATCGPGNFTFCFGADVIRTSDLPET
jgi:hypothetical protein